MLDDAPLERPDPATFFDASVEGTRQDYDDIAAKYRATYYDLTHTPDGTLRTMSEDGEAKIVKLLGRWTAPGAGTNWRATRRTSTPPSASRPR